MKILRPNRVVKSAIFSLAVLSLFFFNSCKKLVDSVDEPNIPGASSGGNRSVVAPEEITATQGAKQKITLEWDFVENATYYHIYYAYNANDEFTKLDETDKNFYEDKVPAGATVYYKIKAEKSNKELSDFSKTVKGTSLAVPTICDGVFDETEATIFWYMQNSRDERTGEDNYEAELQFIVTCRNESTGMVLEEVQLDGYQDHYTFTNLEPNNSYLYSISAFLLSDQTETEDSPEVSAATLLAFTPQAPKVTASEGTNKDGVELVITLPPVVQVTTTTTKSPKDLVNENYPLRFTIERKLEKDDNSKYLPISGFEYLYYNGSTNIAVDENNPDSSYYRQNPYGPGSELKWIDTSVTRGVKYTYRIKSYTDVNYSKVIGSKYETINGSKKTAEVTGWRIAEVQFNRIHPNVYSPHGYYETTGTEGESDYKISKIAIGFNMVWNDLGNGSAYKFAIEQSRREITNKNNVISKTWVINPVTGGNLFGSIAEVKNRQIAFEDPAGQEGYYVFTLYIVPSSLTSADGCESKAYDFKSSDEEPVSTNTAKATAKITEIISGYKDKVKIKFETEANAKYWFERTGEDVTEKIEAAVVGVTGEYIDKNLKSGVKYTYKLYASIEGSPIATNNSKDAETLGKPNPQFMTNELDYNKITINMPQVLAATSYSATIGSKSFTFNQDGTGASGDFKVTKNGESVFVIEISNPDGYNDAKEAGKLIDFSITAKSDATQIDDGDNVCAGDVLKTRVLGPAGVNAKVATFAESKEDSISVSWDKIEGAKGYIIRRVRYNDVAMTDADDSAANIYYVEGKIITESKAGETKDRAAVTLSGETYTLTDTYKEKDSEDPDAQVYQKNQSRISWGLPYRYLVLPVKTKDDFAFKDNTFEITSGTKYENLEPTDGVATWGYGLRVDAAKAESTTQQKVEWTAPFYGDQLTPVLYKRAFNSGSRTNSWTRVVQETNTNTSHNFTPAETYTAVEYAVKYVRNAGKEEEVLPQSFITEYLEETLENDVCYDYGSNAKEPLNKGYLLSIKYTAAYGGTEDDAAGTGTTKSENYYSETVSLEPWDYTERALGPTKYEINILNNNLTKGWTTVATLDAAYNVTPAELADTTVVKYSNGVRLKPTTIASKTDGSGTTDGVLKVLRDAKHYYKVTITNKFTSGDFTNNNAYAYRQITDEELVKITMLNMAYMLESSSVYGRTDTGYKDGDRDSNAGASGNFTWQKKQSAGGNADFHWYINDYVHRYPKLPSSNTGFTSFLSMADYNTENSTRGAHTNKTAHLRCISTTKDYGTSNLVSITVSPSNAFTDLDLSSYSGTVKFSQSDNKFYATVGGYNTGEISGEDAIKYWSPIRIGNVNKFFGDETNGKNYGWWPN